MENASKALLMAGGVLLVMLVIGVLIFAWSSFSNFYNSKDEFSEIEDTAKFNSQFTPFDRKKVHGYELVSLANKVADYNNRYTNAENAKNDILYNKITMTIDFDHKADLLRNNDNLEQISILFTDNVYSGDRVKNFIEEATGIENRLGNVDVATKLAKSIGELILTSEQIEYNKNVLGMEPEHSMKNAIQKYNSMVLEENKIVISDYTSIENAYKAMNEKITREANIMKYYEYYQFKKAYFNCVGINYDTNGRVVSIGYIFTGDIE